MRSEAHKLYVGWRARPGKHSACAVRLARMLQGLAKAHPAFAPDKGHGAAADKSAWVMPPDINELTEVFEKGRQYRDVPREPWPELGDPVAA